MAERKKVEIFADGGCRGNPGPGGWGTIMRFRGKEKELSGFEPHTTNNRMELTAAIRGFEALKEPVDVVFYSDSQYVVKGMTEWIEGWKRRGWKSASKQPVANQDLWEQLDKVAAPHKVSWNWVRGHSGHVENERCDELANAAMDARGG